MLLASAGTLLAEHGAIDKACAPAALTKHDHSAHRIGAEPEQPPEHCDACHFARTARGIVAANQLISSSAAPIPAPAFAHEPAARFDLRTDFTRGPPAS